MLGKLRESHSTFCRSGRTIVARGAVIIVSTATTISVSTRAWPSIVHPASTAVSICVPRFHAKIIHSMSCIVVAPDEEMSTALRIAKISRISDEAFQVLICGGFHGTRYFRCANGRSCGAGRVLGCQIVVAEVSMT